MNRPPIKTALAIICIIGSLLFGILIYTQAREHDLWLHEVLRKMRLLGDSGANSTSALTVLPRWLLDSLPNGLWMFALSLTILTSWNFKLHRNSILWLVIGVLLGISLELLQLTEMWQGSFDWMDIIFIITGSSLAVFCFTPFSQR